SLVRDMKVNLPFYKNKYKINTANAFGGPLLAVKTVNEVFGLNIRHYVSINFNGFVKVIDSLGGVELILTAGESRIVGVPHLDEPQLLDGTQALEYVRIRKLDDNFGRNERQRKLLSSLFNKMMKDSNIETAVKAMTEALRHMATNLSINDLLTLVVPVLSGMETMETTGFPAVGDYRHETNAKTNDSYIVFDLEATRQKLHNYIYQ
ncbi:MAG TPA: LCP family protein, partial [Clostridia bacterium]|nr:LCP family protein [Clostridia bacterium]